MQVGRSGNWVVGMVSKKVFPGIFLAYPPAYFTKPVEMLITLSTSVGLDDISSKDPPTWKNRSNNPRIAAPVKGICPVWELETGDAGVHLLSVSCFEVEEWYSLSKETGIPKKVTWLLKWTENSDVLLLEGEKFEILVLPFSFVFFSFF